MKLTDQVTSEALSVRLRDLRVPQNSYFEWYLTPVGDDGEANAILAKRDVIKIRSMNDHCSAFTVAELGEILPWDIVIHRSIIRDWTLTYQANRKHEGNVKSFQGANETEIRGLMLEYLITNNLMHV